MPPPPNHVATIWVQQDGDEMTLTLGTVADVPPFDKPLLVHLLREFADTLDATRVPDPFDG